MKLTATNSSAFQRLQTNTGTFATTNLFNASANGDPDSVEVCLDIPLSDESDPCNSTITGQCEISYRGQGAGDNPGGVLACPTLAVVGSMGGRDETWGQPCGNVSILPGARDRGSNTSVVYDLNIPAAAVGYPVQAANTPSTIVTIDAEEKGDPGNHNYFLDAYLYDTTQNPASDGNGGDYGGTINGISGRNNRTWNAALFLRHPDLSNIQSFTGGTVFVPSVNIGGFPHQVRIKHETGGANNFPQVIFVWLNADATSRTQRTIDFKDYSDYMLSQDFWDAIQASPAAQAVITAMANPTNGAPAVNAIRPNGAMYWDGFKVGNELWGTVNTGTQTRICYDTLDIQVAGFEWSGKSTSVDCSGCVDTSADCSGCLDTGGSTSACQLCIDGTCATGKVTVQSNGGQHSLCNNGTGPGQLIQVTPGTSDAIDNPLPIDWGGLTGEDTSILEPGQCVRTYVPPGTIAEFILCC